jgi:hypothetical protein
MITPSFSLTSTERTLPRRTLDWTTGVAQLGVDVARVGVATFVGSNGLIQSAPENSQRIDWSQGVPSLLIEESRTNITNYSEQLNLSWWARLRASITPDATVAPDGALTGDKLVEDTTANNTHFLRTFDYSTVSGASYTWSAYLKAGERTKARVALQMFFSGSAYPTTNPRVTVDLETGSLSGAAGTTATSITNAGNGWYRVTVSATADATTSSQFAGVYMLDDAGNQSYTGNGTSGLFIWGVQLEAGAFPTSYIPTEASQVTRNADVATITGTNFSDWWQASKGGVLVRARPGTVSGTRPWVQFDDGTANQIIALRGNTTNPELYIVDGGTPQAQIDAGTIAANTDYSLTGWWTTNDCKARLDSGAVVTDTTATIPTVTQARLGSDGTNYLNGHLASISYYDQFTGRRIYTRRKNKVISNLM